MARRRFHVLHVAAGIWLLAGVYFGTRLITFLGHVPANGDCVRPARQPPGCFSIGHPYWWAGVLLWIAGIVGAIVLWRVANNVVAGRTIAGWPREPGTAR